MEIYLVGGAVRDQLLGLPIKEKDWVVVGATVADMLKLGYKQVGKDFPVFLHPKTQEEYALARIERKTGPGYTGFAVDASPKVSLEEDLKRRDLTINAIAQTKEGKLIDPYGGQADLTACRLRHVSAAFSEDPVRILRIARFAARFNQLGFQVAAETLALMQQMIASGEVDALVAERVWKEVERALSEPNPEQFFMVLEQCHALNKLFPSLSQNSPGIAALKRAAALTHEPVIRFAALLSHLPLIDIKNLCQRYRIPNHYYELAMLAAQYHDINFKNLTAEKLLELLQKTDAFRRFERFQNFLTTLTAIQNQDQQWLIPLYQAAKNIDIKPLLEQGLKGEELAKTIKEKRLASVLRIMPAGF